MKIWVKMIQFLTLLQAASVLLVEDMMRQVLNCGEEHLD